MSDELTTEVPESLALHSADSITFLLNGLCSIYRMDWLWKEGVSVMDLAGDVRSV